jgi:tRNA (guanine-N7-)-methyltransferase
MGRVSGLTEVPTFRRRGRATLGQADALSRLWPALGVAVDGAPLDLPALFGRHRPVALEVGFGMGEATVAFAAARPDVDVLAVEVHPPGLGSLLRLVEEHGLSNVRVADGDARVVLRSMLQPASLDEVRVFFPDPWPKRRHWKRRLVGPAFADLVADRLRPGGRLHVATDWHPYAEQVRLLLGGHPAYALLDEAPWRPFTRFERRGIAAGRPAVDLVAVRAH